MSSASSPDLFLRGESLDALELVKDVAVRVERHRRRVTELARDLHDRRAFIDQHCTAMARENVELARRSVQAFNDRDWDALWEICADDVVWRLIGGFADLGGAEFQGRDALRWLTDWIETIEGRSEIETLLEAGDQVVVIQNMQGAGSASGAPATMRSGLVFSFRDGQISTVDSYYEASEALEAVGLSKDARS
jgi:ketosteroid isomerase-like protein